MKKTANKKIKTSKNIKQPFWMLLLLAVISGLMCVGSFPDINLNGLAWIALIPLFYALSNATDKQSFFVGWLFGAVHTIGVCYWVFYAMHENSNAGFWVSLIFLIIVAGGGIGLYFALFSYAANRAVYRINSELLTAVAISSAWVVMEYCRAHFFTGMPWTLLGHSQYQWTRLIQVSDVTGVYGISFVLVMTNYCLFRAITCWPDKKISMTRLIPAGALITVILVYGSIRISAFTKPQPVGTSPAMTVAVIQGSVPQNNKWRKEKAAEILSDHLRLTENALQQKVDLFIWPETSVSSYLEEKIPLSLTRLLCRYNTMCIIGGPRYMGKQGNYTFYNSAYFLNKNGIIDIHDKQHLFPFGEYFPLGFIDILNLRYAAPRQYSAGHEITLFETPAGRAGILICFEAIFPGLVRKIVNQGAEILINISNDAWFGKTSAHSQHFSMDVFTAVSFRRHFIRAANTGISGFIDPAGIARKQLPQFEKGISLYSPQAVKTISHYCRYGDIFALLCFLVCVFVILPSKT